MGSQCKRVAKALDKHPTGICAVDFLLPNVVDGGPPITRLAARIKDLRDAGEAIDVIGERHGCAVYARARAQVQPVTPAPDPVPAAEPVAQAPLFEFAPRAAIFDEDAA